MYWRRNVSLPKGAAMAPHEFRATSLGWFQRTTLSSVLEGARKRREARKRINAALRHLPVRMQSEILAEVLLAQFASTEES